LKSWVASQLFPILRSAKSITRPEGPREDEASITH
jgi:hypothetical protein